MRFHYLPLLVVILSSTVSSAQQLTPYESSGGTESAAYFQAIGHYNKLDTKYKTIKMQTAGPSDMEQPLHVVYYSKDALFDVKDWKSKNKLVILINNGIHPGEPDGIDASMMLMRDAASGKLGVPDNVVLAVIPVFNIGGALNRGSYSRANQNGPKEYGFRGSAQNLDLNRDFIKLDARETQSLIQLFHHLDPDVFIDNHVSNGADYQHVMTLLTVNPAKQGYHMGPYLQNEFEPSIYALMKKKGYDLVPYVNHWGHTPDKGWQQFYEPPRFASGFAALFGTFAFVPETHMLKPYKQRVEATYALMEAFIEYSGEHATAITQAREMERKALRERKELTIDWVTDTLQHTEIEFRGYEAKYKPSQVSGQPRLYYDRTKPYTKMVPFYNKFNPSLKAMAPKYYVIQQGWHKVINRLKWNGVKMTKLDRDTSILLTAYRITDYETRPGPYEGHYLRSKVQYSKRSEKVRLLKGDYLIPIDQDAKRYLVETLEPNSPDAFFAWGFFDAVLQQKEYFSDYVFEDEALEIMDNHPDIKMRYGHRMKNDPSFAKDGRAQLDLIYRHSHHYEAEHMRYPVFRID